MNPDSLFGDSEFFFYLIAKEKKKGVAEKRNQKN